MAPINSYFVNTKVHSINIKCYLYTPTTKTSCSSVSTVTSYLPCGKSNNRNFSNAPSLNIRSIQLMKTGAWKNSFVLLEVNTSWHGVRSSGKYGRTFKYLNVRNAVSIIISMNLPHVNPIVMKWIDFMGW